jgi:hypothetical protein
MSQVMCRFSDAGNDGLTTRSGGRRPKSAKARNRGRGVGRQRCGGRYGDLTTPRELKAGRLATAVRLECEHNLNVLARILLNGEFTFCPIRDFNELAVAEEHTRQLLRESFTTNFGQHGSETDTRGL